MPQFLQGVTVPARNRIWRSPLDLGNLLEGVAMPNLEHHNLPLLLRQQAELAHRFALPFRSRPAGLKPPLRLQLTPEPSPKPSSIVQRPVPKRPQAIVFRVRRTVIRLQECDEGLLQDILRLTMAQAQGTPIEHQFGRFGLIQRFPTGI